MNRVTTIGLLAVAAILGFATANASEQIAESYACVLDGASVFPPINPFPLPAVGRIDLFLNASNQLSYSMYDCAGFSTVEAHIHGPAGPIALGPIIFTIPPATSEGYRTGVLGVLDAQQIRDLNCAQWYVDLGESPEHPFGVLRGQLRGLWNWQPAWPCFLATEASTWGAVKSLYR